MTKNCQKIVKKGPKMVKISKNGQNYKITKILNMTKKMVKMTKKIFKMTIFFENDQKLAKF